MISIEGIRQLMIEAETKGRYYNGAFGVDLLPCTYWLTDDYIITYITDDPVLCVDMLTEDHMDDLIVEEW